MTIQFRMVYKHTGRGIKGYEEGKKRNLQAYFKKFTGYSDYGGIQIDECCATFHVIAS